MLPSFAHWHKSHKNTPSPVFFRNLSLYEDNIKSDFTVSNEKLILICKINIPQSQSDGYRWILELNLKLIYAFIKVINKHKGSIEVHNIHTWNISIIELHPNYVWNWILWNKRCQKPLTILFLHNTRHTSIVNRDLQISRASLWCINCKKQE